MSSRAQSRDPPQQKRHAAYPRQPARPWRLAIERSPATETKTTAHDYPKYSPVAAHRLARTGSVLFADGGNLARDRIDQNGVNFVLLRTERHVPVVSSRRRNRVFEVAHVDFGVQSTRLLSRFSAIFNASSALISSPVNTVLSSIVSEYSPQLKVATAEPFTHSTSSAE